MKQRSLTMAFLLCTAPMFALSPSLTGTAKAQDSEAVPSITEETHEAVTIQGSGDNPLTTSFSFTGKVGLAIDVIPFNGFSSAATFNISDIPATATTEKALMYVQRWSPPLADASANLAGNSLGSLSPFSADPQSIFVLQTYRFDATTSVAGNGSYPFTFSTGGGLNYFAALVVVFSDASLPSRRIHINDGSEALGGTSTVLTSTTTYSDLVPGPGTLTIVTQADNDGGMSESIGFNTDTILGPGDIFNANLGAYASLFQLPVTVLAGTNTARLSTADDLFGWHLAILESPGNRAPVANPNGPYLGAADSPIAFDGTGSSDPDGDPLTYDWDFGDGGAGTGATPDHPYSGAGIYDVCLTVSDGSVNSDPACTVAVVFDPSSGFVTGGGWIESPAGAYRLDTSLAGKANFGFVSKYRKGTRVPEGNTEFQFKTAELDFHSSNYDWLVVTGSDYARFKGTGTINGSGAYKFMIWAGDGDPDTFRIKIWTEDELGVETIEYDNGMDQAIGGGSIVIHAK